MCLQQSAGFLWSRPRVGAGAFWLQPFGSGDKGRDKPTQRLAAIEQTPQSSGRLRQEIPLLYLLRRCRSASSNYNLFPIMSSKDSDRFVKYFTFNNVII